jgi:hypothetical protein
MSSHPSPFFLHLFTVMRTRSGQKLIVMQTRSGQKLPLYYCGDPGASSSASTVTPAISAPANAFISFGSSTNISQGSSSNTSNDYSNRPTSIEEFDEDDTHFDLIMNMLDNLMMK